MSYQFRLPVTQKEPPQFSVLFLYFRPADDVIITAFMNHLLSAPPFQVDSDPIKALPGMPCRVCRCRHTYIFSKGYRSDRSVWFSERHSHDMKNPPGYNIQEGEIIKIQFCQESAFLCASLADNTDLLSICCLLSTSVSGSRIKWTF